MATANTDVEKERAYIAFELRAERVRPGNGKRRAAVRRAAIKRFSSLQASNLAIGDEAIAVDNTERALESFTIKGACVKIGR